MRSAWLAAGIAGAISVGPLPAQALELKDLVIVFDAIASYESTSDDGRPVYRTKPEKREMQMDAIGGTLVRYGGSTCRKTAFSLVYKPGPNAGSVSCAVERQGTSSSWHEKGGSASFTTNTTIAGNVATLQGTLSAKGITNSQHCGDRYSIDTTLTATQSLRIRIVGKTCQVLQLNEVTTTRDVWSGSNPRTNVSTWTYRLAPGGKCTVKVRSEQPAPPPSGAVSATRNC